MCPLGHVSEPRLMESGHLLKSEVQMFRIYQENNIIYKTIYLFTYKAALAQLNPIFRLEDANCSCLHGWFL